ncbi:Poly(A)-specific ribonuclease PARN [Linum grandiflorum]
MSMKQWLPRLTRALSRAYSSSPTTSFPLKHVTKSNFESSLAELTTHVRAADFVAIDLEMTGVTSSAWRESFEFDRPDVRYLKVKDSADKFAVVQFGVSPFRWDPQRDSFVAHPYNFYIFPREEIQSAGPSHEFLCQTAALDFLAKYQFDFNTCIREGISYLSRGQEDESLCRLSELSNDSEDRDMPLINFTDVLFSERMKNRLSGWRTGLLQGTNDASEDSEQGFQTVFFKLRPAVSLSGFTSHQLNLIRMVMLLYLVSKKHFKDLVHVRISGENGCSEQLVVYTDTENDKALLLTEVKNAYLGEAEKKIKAAIGFRHVIDLLSSEKKLIVGHNCFLDIAHVYKKFLGPLPCTAEEFVSSFHKHFPYIVDTKILLNSSDVLQKIMNKSSTSLSSAYLLLCKRITLGAADKASDLGYCPSIKIEVEMDDTRSTDWQSGAKHEAGYDAFMTGCIFAQSCNYLGVDFKQHSPPLNLALHQKLEKHINRLYLNWANGDIIDLTTGKQIPAVGFKGPSRRFSKIEFENVVLIWRFPSKLTVREIKECICKVFGLSSVASIFRVDESAVLVHFDKPELVSDFLLLKETLEKSNDALSALNPLSSLLVGGRTRAAGYHTYKEICRSPVSRVLLADAADALSRNLEQ